MKRRASTAVAVPGVWDGESVVRWPEDDTGNSQIFVQFFDVQRVFECSFIYMRQAVKYRHNTAGHWNFDMWLDMDMRRKEWKGTTDDDPAVGLDQHVFACNVGIVKRGDCGVISDVGSLVILRGWQSSWKACNNTQPCGSANFPHAHTALPQPQAYCKASGGLTCVLVCGVVNLSPYAVLSHTIR